VPHRLDYRKSAIEMHPTRRAWSFLTLQASRGKQIGIGHFEVGELPLARFASTLSTPGQYRLASLASSLREILKR
jgi:hypothetical protein